MPRPRLLLHCCCGPCTTAVYERLARDFDVVCYWYNPNIQPAEEYRKRLDALRQLADATGMELLIEEGGEDEWAGAIAGLEDEPEGGRRCDVCFRLRLEKAAAKAAQLGCECFSTTLTVSPYKPAATINPIGEAAAEETGLKFLAADFKQRDGFKRSVELSKQYGLYRQKYCGCMYSMCGRNTPAPR